MAVLDKSDDSVKGGSLDGDNEGGCNAKTPVSLLQELYVRRGITPKYDLVQIEGAVHEPTFKYRVTIGEFVATGCGQSKKKAKHSAAKSILDKLLGAQNAGIAPPGQPTIPDLAQDIFSPYDDGIEGNPVGILQELCMSRRWPPPTYELNHEEGLPHERSFVMICIINKHRETGHGKSKKLAKRQAANRMIKKLQMLPSDNEDGNQNIDEDDLAQVSGDITLTSRNLAEIIIIEAQ
ncbi:RISC-loading complex subunit TARBP2 [Eurytemora carolleeae]|uniref:RISC-loading complex subunit TARBP2 n=1 Tax=Eurytemora carolleeae TaxID=1294199 RepID=UPI000C78E96E|nr:RISC-loading complex subunit TARBP2 [Eurytemora carolleeae]|eukprot:XP_023338419.1 RISC-loading complex subunit TARBP2-like [Eurytemora affinis]